jgi:hypothetical protein
MGDPVVVVPEGLYCPAGDFLIDPWRPVEEADTISALPELLEQ